METDLCRLAFPVRLPRWILIAAPHRGSLSILLATLKLNDLNEHLVGPALIDNRVRLTGLVYADFQVATST